MAPTGLIISKLAVQTTVQDETARVLLCLKISVPQEHGGGAQRWGLFSADAPQNVSIPQIHSLPLPVDVKGHAASAAFLLSLPLGHRNDRAADASRRLMIEISKSNGQVYVVSEQNAQKRRRDNLPSSSSAQAARRDFLVTMEFEQEVDRVGMGYRLDLPTPRCLDNIVRFQICPPAASTSSATGEVSIVTEPKILPIPAANFRDVKRGSGVLQEDGWEDGESLGPEDMDSDDGEDGTSWLEGRFQSTDYLRFEWSFASSGLSVASLRVSPRFHRQHPLISMQYDALVPCSSPISLEADLPDGWGWSGLSIVGDHLQSWSCVDGEWWDQQLEYHSTQAFEADESSVVEPDDSFSTIRARRNPSARPSASSSLMRQPLPPVDDGTEEFSFEVGHAPPRTPMTPASARSASIAGDIASSLRLPKPVPARLFELTLSDLGAESAIRVTGTLVPLNKTLLVSPSVPIKVPTLRLDGGEQCHLYVGDANPPILIDVARPPPLTWLNEHGIPVPPEHKAIIKGDVTLQMVRRLSHHTFSINFLWPGNATEIHMRIPRRCEIGDVKVIKAAIKGRAIPRAVCISGDHAEIILGKGDASHGLCSIVVELLGEPIIPVFEGTAGRLRVQLSGEGWRDDDIKTNLTRHCANSYSTPLPLSKSPYLTLSPIPSPASRSLGRSIWSWSTLVNVFMLYLLLSLAQQVQRLRSEVAFIGEEAKDLRMYGVRVEELSERLAKVHQPLQGFPVSDAASANGVATPWDPVGTREPVPSEFTDVHKQDTALGRVVWGQSGWERLFAHPTIRLLGQSLGWLWDTVVWLMHA